MRNLNESSEEILLKKERKEDNLWWNREHTKQLIKLFKRQQLLWDRTHPQWSDQDAREAARYEILNEIIEIKPDVTLREIKRKIRTLQTQHSQAQRDLRRYRRAEPVLWCYELLNFLRGEPNSAELTKETTADPLAEDNEDANDSKEKRIDVWTRDIEKLLIAEYKKHRALWDPEHQNYGSYELRTQMFNEIRAALPPNNFSIFDIRRRVRNLRSQFGEQLRQLEAARKCGKQLQARLWCYNELSFLKPIIYIMTQLRPNKNEYSRSKISVHEDEDQNEGCDTESEHNMPELIQSESHTTLLTSKRRKLTENEDEEEPTPPRRFAWLGEQLVTTLNNLEDEETICDTVTQVQQVLQAAESSENLQKLQMLQPQSTTTASQQFNVLLSFDAQQQDLNELFAAIAQLPSLQQVQLNGTNLRNAVMQQPNL